MIILFSMIIVSCGRRGNSDDGGWKRMWNSEDASDSKSSNESESLIRCPLCGGDGIYEYMPGDIFAPKEKCATCNGTGYVDAKKARKDLQLRTDINNWLNGGNNTSNGGGGNGLRSERDHNNSGRIQCPICNGSGLCDICAGRGFIIYDTHDGGTGFYECSFCHGRGKCSNCHGSGTIAK